MQRYNYNNFNNYNNYDSYPSQGKKKELSPAKAVLLVFGLFLLFVILFGGGEVDTSYSSNNSYFSSVTSSYKAKESRSTYIQKCRTIEYSSLARNPMSYVGNDYQFTGKVIQVINGYNNNVELRVNVTPMHYEFLDETYYEDTIYVTYQYSSSYEDKILEDDIITIYGTHKGIQDYISILGAKISIPRIDAMYIDIR